MNLKFKKLRSICGVEISFECTPAFYLLFTICDHVYSVYRERRYGPHILQDKMLKDVNYAQELLRNKSSHIILSVISPYYIHVMYCNVTDYSSKPNLSPLGLRRMHYSFSMPFRIQNWLRAHH